MADNSQDLPLTELRRLTRALSILCVLSPALATKSLGVHARLLKSIGFDNAEIAGILGSTANSIGVRLAETKSWRPQAGKADEA
jgi:hypothetical protein